MKLFFKRFGRNVLGLALGVVAASSAEFIGLIDFPSYIAPFVPMVLGPLFNGAAKIGREILEPGLARKVAEIF